MWRLKVRFLVTVIIISGKPSDIRGIFEKAKFTFIGKFRQILIELRACNLVVNWIIIYDKQICAYS